MALLNGPFVYTPEPNLTGYSVKLAAARLALVNTWATAAAVSDDTASKVDDFVRYLQTTNNAWDLYTDVWVFVGSGLTVNLKGSLALTNSGLLAGDNTLAEGVGPDDISTVRNLLIPITTNTQYDAACFLTKAPTTDRNFIHYSGTIGANPARLFSVGGARPTRDFTAGGQALENELTAGSGWRRMTNNGGATYRSMSETQLGNQQGPFNGGVNDNASLYPPLVAASSNVLVLNRSGAKIRVLCYKESATYYDNAAAMAVTNTPWAIACRTLDAALRGKVAKHVVVIGDSITAGSNEKSRFSFAPWLETITGDTKAINVSRSGNSVLPRPSSAQPGMYGDYTTGAKPFVLAGQVEHIVWASGVNDVNFRGSLVADGYPGVDTSDSALIAAIKTEVLKCIDQAIADGIPASQQTLLGKMYGPVPWNVRAISDQALIQAGDERNVRFVDSFALTQASNSALRNTWYENNPYIFGNPFDNIHPNNAGQSLLADVFLRGNTVEQEVSLHNGSVDWIEQADASSYELGSTFRVNRNGWITKLRNYRLAGGPQTVRSIKLWTTGGVLIFAGLTINETGTGYEEVPLPTPLQVTAGQEFMVSCAVTGLRPRVNNGRVEMNTTVFTYLNSFYITVPDTFPTLPGGPDEFYGSDVVLAVAAPVSISGLLKSVERIDGSSLYSPFAVGRIGSVENPDRLNLAGSLTPPQPPPAITAVNKTVAETGDAVIVTVASTQYVTGATYGGAPVLTFSILSATQIRVTLPYGVVGSFGIQVRGTNGALSAASAAILTRPGQLGYRRKRRHLLG